VDFHSGSTENDATSEFKETSDFIGGRWSAANRTRYPFRDVILSAAKDLLCETTGDDICWHCGVQRLTHAYRQQNRSFAVLRMIIFQHVAMDIPLEFQRAPQNHLPR
jgi:hypothetical protein